MEQLVQKLIKNGTLVSQNIIEAFYAIDRKDFIPEESQALAHTDQPIHIGYQQTISQPTTVAFMLELLNVKKGHRVLDIGSGSCWTTALLAHLVGPEGFVVGIERVEELVAFGTQNLAKYHFANVHVERAGSELGKPKDPPYDRILVSAAARSFPKELLSQVHEEGIIVLPVRDTIWKVVRVEHQPIIEKFEGYIFVPLIIKEA
ncbi:TPA: protein-L-isoaspartate O-methyltransferase [Patescibacteria group bacterium]|nr:MAG: hypothetical protein UU98_C0029G0006 [Parcubacteria group bacterium GW2011_GWD2_42_14]HCC05329.1 protein-L-isoaspartate O-methyltransferase [Patescibacteria group bacterium]